MKSHSDELETEVSALRGTIQSLRHKLKNASASQLPPLPQAATAHESRAQTSTPLGGALQLDNPNRKYSFAPPSPAPNEDEVRISEAIGRLGDLREEEQPAVAIVAESLPHLVKGVIFARRQELIPIFLVVIRSHPDPSVRDMLTRLLFNLIAKPDQVQREMIMAGCSGLASLIGRQKTEVELLPQCWEQIGAKSEERRVLVAESCGRLAPFVRPELRPSLILSILSQLLEDASPVVRQAVSKNFALLISHFGEAEIPKFPAIQETALRLLYDKEQSVSSTTQRALLPLFVDWADACDLLPQRFFDVLCNELQGRLLKRQKAGRLYEDDIHVFQTVVDCLV
ncbi:MAG TPA: hypothetical protein VJB16_02390, partial [archaeon]|nr:hypothetical protein [archaeon]